MKLTKKHIPFAIICLLAVLLHLVPGVPTLFLRYLCFSACSLFLPLREKKVRGALILLLCGLVLQPILEMAVTYLLSALPNNLVFFALSVLCETALYFSSFIFVNAWVRGWKFSFTRGSGILLGACLSLYVLIGGVQAMLPVWVAGSATSLNTWQTVLQLDALFGGVAALLFYFALFFVSARLAAIGKKE